MRISLVALCAIVICLSFVAQSTASVLPASHNQKWESQFQGSADLVKDTSGSTSYYRSFSQIHLTGSVFNAQGRFDSGESMFVDGDDGGPNKAPDKNVKGVIAQLIENLVVIAIYDNALGMLSGFTAIDTLITSGGLGNGDIIFFGSESTTKVATGHWYHDPTLTPELGNAGTFSDPLNYTNNSQSIGSLSGATEILTTKFVDLGGTQVDGQGGGNVLAPAGTLVMNSIHSQGNIQTITVQKVVGGTEASKIKKDAMYVDLFTATDLSTTKRLRGDLISSVGKQIGGVPGKPFRATFSDPVEFMTTPEPTTLGIWAAIGGVAGVYSRRRRKAKAA